MNWLGIAAAVVAVVGAFWDYIPKKLPAITPATPAAPVATSQVADAVATLFHAVVDLPADKRDAALPHLDAIKGVFS